MAFTEEEKLHFAILGKRCGGIYHCWKTRNQILEDFSRETETSTDDRMTGYMFGDEQWPECEYVTSSIIEQYGPNNEYIITRNTVYKLGHPQSDFTEKEISEFRWASKGRTGTDSLEKLVKSLDKKVKT